MGGKKKYINMYSVLSRSPAIGGVMLESDIGSGFCDIVYYLMCTSKFICAVCFVLLLFSIARGSLNVVQYFILQELVDSRC